MNLVEAARKMTIGKTAVTPAYLRRLCWYLNSGLALLLFVTGLVEQYRRGFWQMPVLPSVDASPILVNVLANNHFVLGNDLYPLILIAAYFQAAVFVTVGLFLFWRKSGDVMGVVTSWLLISIGLGFTPTIVFLPLFNPLWHIPVTMFQAGLFGMALLFLCLFPNGRFFPHWSRFVALIWLGYILLWFPFPQLNPHRAAAMWPPLIFVAIIALGINFQLWRYRTISEPDEKQQAKWILTGFIVSTTALLGIVLIAVLQSPVVFGAALMLLALAPTLIPITIGIAILRYRLWQIDIILNRTLVYGGLTVGVTAVYLLMVGGLGLLAVGQQWRLLGVVLATAVTAILLKPAHNQLQTHVNRLIPLPPVTQTAVAHPLANQGQPLDLIPAQWQSAVRFFLLIFALGAMTLLLGAIPARLWQLQTVCTEAVCPAIILIPADFAVLQQWGISASAYAIFHTAVELILIVPVVILWVVIFRNCTHRWLGVLTCLGLVYLGVSLGNILWAWTQESPWAAFMGDIVSEIGATALLLLLLLFPDGRFINRWTRYSAYLLLFVLLPFGIVNLILSPGLDDNLPDAINAMAFLLFMLLGAASQIVRYRAYSNQAQKQQTKWVVIGVTSLMLGVLLWFLLMEFFPLPPGLPRLTWNLFGSVLMISLAALFPISLGLAILQYRLWDIDLLINRTLVYGGLTVIVIAIYVLTVWLLSLLFHTSGNLVISLVATGFIAVLFQPLHQRLQRAINRLMFGERDDPYAVLSKLGRQLGETAVPHQTLPAITTTITQTLKLPYAAIELVANDERQPTASSGERGTAVLQEWPLRYQGEIVGWLQAAPRSPGEPFSAKEQQLLGDIAAQAGAAAYAMRLTTRLQRSREKLVLAREEERRRIRRDLHDELGPTLASQTFAIDAVIDLLESNPQEAAQLLHGLKVQNQETVTEIRRLVYELRPPTLDELGLVGALQAHTAQMNKPPHLHIQITARPDRLPSLSAAVEVAAYRIALEAMTNAARHAGAQTCTVHLQAEDAHLTLAVADDGRGLETNGRYGVGLHSMRERAEELGGRLSIESGEKGGTQVTAVLPLSSQSEADGA